MNLWQDFMLNDGKTIHKWVHYFPIYERYFSSWRNKTLTFLEIGVSRGGSLQMWQRYFGPLARIVGIDIDPTCREHAAPGICVRTGDQSDTAFLQSVIEEFGPPDIVLDDGSHEMHHVRKTFEFLYPLLPKNGLYLVEDLHTAYWPEYGGGVNESGSFVNLAKHFIDQLNSDHSRGQVSPDAVISRNTYGISFFDSVIVFEKGQVFWKEAIRTGASAERGFVATNTAKHSGEMPISSLSPRTRILNALIRRFGYSSYLEIGIGDGANFAAIRCAHKHSVDPGSAEALRPASQALTSDQYFAQSKETFDMIFIDGLHHADVVARDIRNALSCLNPGGMVVCHDMNPSSEAMQRVPREQAEWTGDCWRAWLRIRATRDDLAMLVLDTDYGIGIIYPAGTVKTPRLPVDENEVSFDAFQAHKAEWLPLVAEDALAAALGCGTLEGNAVSPPATWDRDLSALPPAARPFLVYCPTKAGDHLADLLSKDRLFDVALNDYTGEGRGTADAEWQFCEMGHKWPCAQRNLSRIAQSYEFYLFLDNDIEIGVDAINTLFLTGYALRLQLFQASLTPDSTTAYPHLRWRAGSAVRFCELVEIMMPVFSRAALQTCAHTFTESESGWGLDHIWPLYLGKDGMAVIDAVQARHCRPVNSRDWVMSNGETPWEEFARVVRRHKDLFNLR
jgi:SAM-dependent methyltransferase